MQQPVFSILIPTCNRPGKLTTCLQAISQLEYPRDQYEVIVIDDGSKQSLAAIVSNFESQLEIILIKQENAGPAAARNTGAKNASGKYLVFTDDDCEPTPSWLQAISKKFVSEPEVLIGGRTINALSNNLYLTASQLLIDYLYKHYTSNGNQPRFFTSNNMALPADLFQKLGGFDLSFRRAGGEDREFCDRWHHNGFHMVYDDDVIVYHSHSLTFSSFWRQHMNYGRGAFIFHQAHARRDKNRIRLEPLSFYLKLLQYPFLQTRGLKSVILALLLVVSQMANAAGFFIKYLKKKPPK